MDGAGSQGYPARVPKTHDTTLPAKWDSSKEKPEWHVLTGIADETWRTGKRMTVKKNFLTGCLTGAIIRLASAPAGCHIAAALAGGYTGIVLGIAGRAACHHAVGRGL